MKHKCIIVDLDDTITKEPFDGDVPIENNRDFWDKYHSDREFYSTKIYKPERNVIDFIESYYNGSYIKPMIIFLTARENLDLIRLNTYRFIRKNFKCFHSPQDFGNKYYLLMRPENDFRPSDVIKEQYLKENILPYYNVIMAFDDDIRNIDMYKRNNILCMQVNLIK